MINTIVEYTNITIKCKREKNKIEKDARTNDTNVEEVRCLLGLLLFRGLFHDTQQSVKELWYSQLSSRPIY